MTGLFTEKRLWDKKWEISIAVARFFELGIQSIPHPLPNGKAIRLNYHTASYGRVIGQAGFDYQIIVPLRIIFISGRYFFCHVFAIFGTKIDVYLSNK
jgi:hypothetical protein